MDEDPTRVAGPPHSYENINFIQERYESVEMSSQIVIQTRLPPALVHKALFAYESSVPSAARADSYGEYKNEINYTKSNCFAECYARALSLIVPPYPLSVGTTH
jgi:hypothetical protein